MCSPESIFDIAIADLLLEDVGLPRAIFVERFVHNVPGNDLTPEVACFPSNMVLHSVEQITARGDAANPARKLIVPDQGVTANRHMVLLCKTNNCIGRSKVECTTRWLGRIPLHLIAWCQSTKLCSQELRVLWV